MVFHAYGFPISAWKNEFHRLVRLRCSGGPVKSHPAGLHMHFFSRCSFKTLRRPLCFRRALQVDLHFAAAENASAHFFILAALRMNRVVPLASPPENSDLHVFEQARILILEIRGFGCFHGENLLVSRHL